MATYTPYPPGIIPSTAMIPDFNSPTSWDDMVRSIKSTYPPELSMQLGKPVFSVFVVGNGFLVSFDGTLEHAHYAQNEQAIADLLISLKAKERIGIATRPADTVVVASGASMPATTF